jgi:Flp pilus assembly protein TadD
MGLMHEVLGEPEAAVEIMRPSAETLFRLGEKSFFSTLAPQMARVLALLGRLDEAEDFALRGRDAAPTDDWASQINWREALALVSAFRGDLDEGERLAREAAAMTEGVDYLPQMAHAWSDLGTVLGLEGRKEEAAEALRQALSLHQAKGNLVSAARTREALAALID